MKYIKQYGLQRSGTNFMRALFELNLDCRVLANIGGHKHYHITNKTNHSEVVTDISKNEIKRIDSLMKKGSIPKVAIIKNVFAWLVSIAKHTKSELSNYFIEKKLALYIEMNKHWMDNCDETIEYESLLMNPAEVLEYYSKKYNLDRKAKLIIPNKAMKRGGDLLAVNNIGYNNFDRSYYVHEKYMDEFEHGQIEYVSNEIKNGGN